MYDRHVERSAGYAGIAFVIVLFIAVFLPGVPPLSDAPPAEIAAFLDGHHTAWMISAWLVFPAAAFFLWFAVQLQAFLKLAPQVDDGLPAYMLVGAVAVAATNIAFASLQIALGFHPASLFGDSVLRVLFDAFNALATLIFVPIAILVFAASQSGRRHASLPLGLVYLGYLAFASSAVASLSVFFTSGFLALGGIGAAVLGIIPFAAWTVWVSIVMIRAPRGRES